MSTFPLLDALARNWWVLLARGIIALLFGVLTFLQPGVTLVSLMILFGIYALVDGVVTLWTGAAARVGWLVYSGILGIIMGIAAFVSPGATAIALYILIALWAIGRGCFEIFAAMELARVTSGEAALVVSGILSILVGLLLVVFPLLGALALIWMIGAYALLFGVSQIVMAYRVRGLANEVKAHVGMA